MHAPRDARPPRGPTGPLQLLEILGVGCKRHERLNAVLADEHAYNSKLRSRVRFLRPDVRGYSSREAARGRGPFREPSEVIRSRSSATWWRTRARRAARRRCARGQLRTSV